ncbi:hypothetical protein SAMN02745196_02806 [Clostridium collagenovorans DSM 3089]|uniref:Uncharacterized protein n=1 Tax=Clostridium collagenovorans DSM 3089 TaxID=1121306 RepID=A0A1M5YCH7_9CLOT|nr:hypothetical protein [Clostridium collagenovorans]SHI09584.1 hypothetical protein SAMN02745196_02806 [Clostridium collagenovorans DSM 3089]
MDDKEKQIIKDLCKKFIDRNYSESDVVSFLIMLRRHAKGIRSITELGDFIAHRDKEKGGVKDYLEKTKNVLDNLGQINTTLVIKEVFTFKEFRNGINRILQNNSISKLDDTIINDLMLFSMSIIQETTIRNKESDKLGILKFSISEAKIILLGEFEIENNNRKVKCSVPVLEVNNRYINMNKMDKFDTPISFNKVIKVEAVSGEIKII